MYLSQPNYVIDLIFQAKLKTEKYTIKMPLFLLKN